MDGLSLCFVQIVGKWVSSNGIVLAFTILNWGFGGQAVALRKSGGLFGSIVGVEEIEKDVRSNLPPFERVNDCYNSITLTCALCLVIFASSFMSSLS